MNVDTAYVHCEHITAAEARNFSYGIRLLPLAKRQAMSALYAMARRIDDIGDGDRPAADKQVALDEVVEDLDAIAARKPCRSDDPVLVALADTAAHFPLPLSAFTELVEGCRQDVLGTRYRMFDDLVGYCRLVAGTVGRLSLAVYGCDDLRQAEPLAESLGVALQITNILRDIVEDHDTLGRIYLPDDDIDRFGCHPDLSGPLEAMMALISFEAARADDWYEEGLRLLPMLDRRSRACTAAMAGIYRQLLRRIKGDPASVLRKRVSLPAWHKAGVAIRSLTLGAA